MFSHGVASNPCARVMAWWSACTISLRMLGLKFCARVGML